MGIDDWYLNEPRPSRSGMRVRALLAVAMGAAIFAIDTFTPLSSAVAVLYVLPMLLVGQERAGSVVVRAGVVVVLLTVTSFLVEHGFSFDVGAALRLAFSLAAIATTGFLLVKQSDAAQLQRAQARLLDVTEDAVILRSLDGRVLLWNQGAEAMYGRSRESMLGRSHLPILRTGFPQPIEEIDAAMAAGSWQGEVEQERADGATLIVNSRWRVQRNTAGEAWGVLETNSDVTACRQAERSWRESEQRYRDIFETQAVAVLEYDFAPIGLALETLRSRGVSDPRGYLARHPGFLALLREEVRVVNLNATGVALLGGQDKAEVLEAQRSFFPFGADAFVDCLMALDAGGGVFERRTRFTTPTGERTALMAVTFPEAREGLDRIPATLIDLTRSERMGDEIAGMRAELDRALRRATMGEVAAAIAHEVNQPLTAIRTYSEAARRWLRREPMDVGQARGALDAVVSAVAAAGEVVIRARGVFARIEPEMRLLPIDDLVADALRLAAREIEASGTLLAIDLRAGPAATVLGDRILLQQTFLSFTMNALKAMEHAPGERRLTVETEVDGPSAIVTFRDTGPGFPVDLLEAGLDAGPNATGFGLAVSRSTVLAHGGSLGVLNAETGGALVRMILPQAVQEARSPFG